MTAIEGIDAELTGTRRQVGADTVVGAISVLLALDALVVEAHRTERALGVLDAPDALIVDAVLALGTVGVFHALQALTADALNLPAALTARSA